MMIVILRSKDCRITNDFGCIAFAHDQALIDCKRLKLNATWEGLTPLQLAKANGHKRWRKDIVCDKN